MKFTKEATIELERLSNIINNHEIFEISKDNGGLYLRRKSELLINIYDWVKIVFGDGDYSCELVDATIDCLKYYKKESGPFTHYFVSSFRKRLYQRARSESFLSIAPPRRRRLSEDVIEVKRLLENLRGQSVHTAGMEDVNVIAMILDVPASRVEEIIVEERSLGCVSDTLENSDGEEYSIIDIMAEPVKSAEDEYMEKNSQNSVMERAQAIYNTLIPSQKRVVSLCFTAEVGEELLDSEENCMLYDIVDYGIMEQYIMGSKKITKSQIASLLGKELPSISRTYKEFKDKLEINLQKCGSF